MNPFTERSRITNPARFTGRWREVSMIFERLEQRRPVMVAGAPGVGKSSLITHVAQSAAVVLEIELSSLFLDLALLPDAATCLRLIVRELGHSGATLSDLEAALQRRGHTVIICFDGAEAAIAAGWGAALLDGLARLARYSTPTYPGGLAPPGEGAYDLLLVAAASGAPPQLSEPLAAVVLGALATSEVRLLVDVYLEETGVEFSSAELRELGRLSAGHPAYLQRAAFHLFRAHSEAGYDWRAAYLDEARTLPVPGSPLPAAIFAGAGAGERVESGYGELGGEGGQPVAPEARIEGVGGMLAALLPLILAIVAFQISGSWPITIAVVVIGYVVVALVLRR